MLLALQGWGEVESALLDAYVAPPPRTLAPTWLRLKGHNPDDDKHVEEFILPREAAMKEAYVKVLREFGQAVSSGKLPKRGPWLARFRKLASVGVDTYREARARMNAQLSGKKARRPRGRAETTIAFDEDALRQQFGDRLEMGADTGFDILDNALGRAPEGLTADDIGRMLRGIVDEWEDGRVDSIVTSDTGFASSRGRLDSMAEHEVKLGRWVTAHDHKVRDTHRIYGKAGTKPIGFNYAKLAGERYILRWPYDEECDEASEVCNCRCYLSPAFH